VRKLLNERTSQAGVIQAFRGSKDPAVFVVVGEDTAALLGVLVAALGVFCRTVCGRRGSTVPPRSSSG
jgi:hypothetical protein